MWVFVCLYITYMPGTHLGQKRRLNHLELELQMIVKCHVSVGVRTWVLWKNNEYF